MKAGNGDRETGNVRARGQVNSLVPYEMRSKLALPVSEKLCVPRSPCPVPRFQKGFSLLEVIAAIMLLAIAFTALMKVAGASISLTKNAADHSEAAMWARSRLDSAFVGEPITPGSSSGQFNEKFRWQLDVTPWNRSTPPNAPLHLYQLDLNVMWGPAAHLRSAHFRTLRLGGPQQGGLEAGNAQAGR